MDPQTASVLPDDVLLMVLAAANKPDVARMMRVCRLFYAAGPMAILRTPVVISSDEGLSRFLVFLYAEGPRRSRFVRSLDVNVRVLNFAPWYNKWVNNRDRGSPNPAVRERFSQLGVALAGMTHLTSLSVTVRSSQELDELLALLDASDSGKTEGKGLYGVLHSLTLEDAIHIRRFDSEAVDRLRDGLLRMTSVRTLSLSGEASHIILYGSRPDLASAFADMPAIQSLHMTSLHGDSESLRLLKTLRFRLASASFGLRPSMRPMMGTTGPQPSPDLHPVEILSHSRETLQELRSDKWYTRPDVLPDPSIVYPKMRRLRLYYAGLPLTMAYIHAYPNLAYLEYSTVEGQSQSHDSLSVQLYDERRGVNVAAQILSGRTWAHLEEFRGTLADLYMLGLTCHIDQIHLRLGPDELGYQLDPVLSHARPRYLELSQERPKRLYNLDFPEHLPDAIPEAVRQVFDALHGDGGSRLECLRMAFDFGCIAQGIIYVDVPAVMEGLAASLSNSPLRDLKLDISLTSIYLELYEYAGPLWPAERVAQDFDLNEWMCDLGERIATLRTAQVVFYGPRDLRRTVTLESGQVRYED